ncbi:putative oxidoreductase [Mucilaginibacter yixingensis]|uniref:Putative oxidoreductase n=1 Tax=Mucilaginibacter yixingensis TaxID=1295612 RepID=A0A2T5J671_9SPHI|nr:SDR family NAD(P)-dependent oxidoreductase [Mucilaginibacter yixingensis]PTQ94037.1 putative oxidoreductase [Mucilaginibacter yixingensis]
MNTTNKTALITGGGSGIGFEIAKQLVAKGNKVIITGRTEAKLKAAADEIGAAYFTADINKPADTDALKNFLLAEFGGLDVLINNAGHAYYYQPGPDADAATKAADEFQTNFFSAVRLTEELLPLLQKSAEAAIVNVTSIVALVPSTIISTYSASKAALHSYTQTLRYALSKTTNIKVFELMPPLVNTAFSAEIGGENGIPPAEVADTLLHGFENDVYEIHTGNTAGIHALAYAPTYNDAFLALNER